MVIFASDHCTDNMMAMIAPACPLPKLQQIPGTAAPNLRSTRSNLRGIAPNRRSSAVARFGYVRRVVSDEDGAFVFPDDLVMSEPALLVELLLHGLAQVLQGARCLGRKDLLSHS
ncbi:hypothetical protein CKO40_04165 [Halochromatium glycolicum]|uniref:Uncharacterized protein n=1 Tax=Halochromatium glycolicum TaxID=85075 RepID=A0AAJ0U211_9GAMM|nr:hypothetical protein [Halochromatium glycolicum]